jgi:hypothetical protein
MSILCPGNLIISIPNSLILNSSIELQLDGSAARVFIVRDSGGKASYKYKGSSKGFSIKAHSFFVEYD